MHLTFSQALISLLASGAPLAAGFEVTFYLGSQCRGARWGTGHYRYPGFPNVCHNIPTNTVSATIRAEDNDPPIYSTYFIIFFSQYYLDTNKHIPDVAFWKDGCGKKLMGSGDGGECVNFSGATTFSVREDFTVPGKVQKLKLPGKVRREPQPWEHAQDLHRRALNVPIEHAEGSLSPNFDPEALTRAGFGHGDVGVDAGGRKVRWRQVALGIAEGVPVEEWDDKIHTRGEHFVAYGHSSSEVDVDGPPGSGWSVAPREGDLFQRWDYAKCRALLTCARNVAGGVTMTIKDGWPQLVDCAKKKLAYGQTLYDRVSRNNVVCFLSKSLFNGAVGGGIGYGIGVIGGGGGATKDDNDQLAKCSNNDQANAFIDAMVKAGNAGNENAARVDVNMGNGHTLVLYGRVYPKDKVPPMDLCPA